MPGNLCPSKRLDQIHPLPQKGTKYPIEKIKHSEKVLTHSVMVAGTRERKSYQDSSLYGQMYELRTDCLD